MEPKLSPSGKYISIKGDFLDREEAFELVEKLKELIQKMPVDIRGGKE